MTRLLIPCLVSVLAALAQAQAPTDPIDDRGWIQDNGGEDGLDAAMALSYPSPSVLAVLAESDAPERFLARLAELAAADDPDLPARCLAAALAIGERLRASDLSAREASLDPEVITAFEALGASSQGREDVRAAALAVAAKLRALL